MTCHDPTARAPLLRADGLSFRYAGAAFLALRAMDLRIEPGELILVAGPSGGGKSTLLRAFAGLVPHFYPGEMRGHVIAAGLDTRDHPPRDLFTHAAYVGQSPDAALFSSTVERELAFGLESLGLPPAAIRRRVGEVVEQLGLSHLLARPPHDLSGGEKQLVAVAAALATQPQALLLDEPFANLDSVGAERLRAMLRHARRAGTAVLVAEHRLYALAAEADRLIVMAEGQVVMDAPPRVALMQDLSRFGVNVPVYARLARRLGLPTAPLTLDEARCAFACVSGAGTGDGRIAAEDLALPVRPSAGGPALVEVRGLRHVIGHQPVLCAADFTARAGECVALVGANGSGKTTLVKHFNGLRRAMAGEIRVAGRDVQRAKVAELAQHVGFAFQNPDDQFFAPTVREELAAGPRALGGLDPARLDGLIERFDLGPLLDRSPYRLSGGEKKRLTFAAALAADPEILVLDEPTAGQDDRFRSILGTLIADRLDAGRAVVLVTHDLELAEAHAAQWYVLAGGRTLASGSPTMVMSNVSLLAAARLHPTDRFQLAQLIAAG